MNKLKLTSIVTLALGIHLLVSISLSSAAVKFYYQDTILPGTSVQGIEIGGLKYQEAVEKLTQALPWPDPKSLLVLVDPDGQPTDIHYGDIQYQADYSLTVKKALELSEQATSWQNLFCLLSTLQKGRDLPLLRSFDTAAFDKVLHQLAERYYQSPRNAQLILNGDSVTIVQDIKGRALDNPATIKQLMDLPVQEHRVNLQFRTMEPQIRAVDYQGINSRLAIFVTQFEPNNQARTHNIRLASQLINNSILKPKELFSLNKALGPRIQQNGYLQAPVIINNKLVPDYGGGVCQVGTTLYNSVLLAGLTVVERVPHSLPVPYAPAGKDATLAGDLIDFKFLNNTEFPILINSQIQQGKVLVSIFGHREGATSRLIRIATERTVTKASREYIEQATLSPGQVRVQRPGRDGYQLKTYEVTLENGKEVRRQLISNNVVEPEAEIIAVGPKVNTKGIVKK
ncbi:VanW family protein [Desulforamulus aeronauticus]|uniref:Vancomycin resistance protein YoaR, contains peptidoglycan-binding and VanW domains n=1 Tax=Desulforamulus aeronauticus DSM 10349 TaxID=1121421 RepID=A0A1M6TM81_9FIRM|nr:VanW family protein [Desulforamulus aeronauticus]SHK58067.1 Vancomycin resistance protein YoaR, contains peptidoglycan-binding and VanW domains [Desulforamulus aeronauticus DSM 10349]